MIAGSVGISESSGYQSGSNAYKKGDFVTALQHWTIAAQKGDVRAQFNVATMHFKGRRTPKNDRIAVKWYTLAAKQGYANAQFSLGLMYDNGNGVPMRLVHPAAKQEMQARRTIWGLYRTERAF